MTTLELAANLATAVSIALAALNRIHTWWIGMVGCALFAALFLEQRLYADVLLQGFFVVTSLIGWQRWRTHGLQGDKGVSHAPPRSLPWLLLVAAVVTVAYGALLQAFTDAAAPYPDSAVLALSVIAQLLLMRRRVETWPIWLLVNSIAVPLFASRGLWLTATLYGCYWLNAWFGWWRWHRLAATAP